MKVDKNMLLTVGAGLLYVAGMVAKGTVDKKNEETKLAELVEKAVEKKLNSENK